MNANAVDGTSSQRTSPRIKSFVLRSGRMTAAQRQAYHEHMEKWSLALQDGEANFDNIFGNINPVTLEIGFGMGDSLAQMAKEMPQHNFIGVEVHRPGVGRLLHLVEENALSNVRVYCNDAVEVIEHCISEHSLSRVNIYFPDPWQKKKHHKRRLIQSKFLTLLHSRIVHRGLLHIATDWQNYTEHILKEIDRSQKFDNIAGDSVFVNAADFNRPETKFERRGTRSGHRVWDMAFCAKSAE